MESHYSINSFSIDFRVETSLSLRNLTRTDGSLITPLMYNGSFSSLNQVLAHYGNIRVDSRKIT
jgi:cytochrome c peroxidase